MVTNILHYSCPSDQEMDFLTFLRTLLEVSVCRTPKEQLVNTSDNSVNVFKETMNTEPFTEFHKWGGLATVKTKLCLFIL